MLNTGWISPTEGHYDASGSNWSDLDNIISDNDVAASNSVVSGTASKFLYGTLYGFNIPSSATIRGIEVKIKRKSAYTENWTHLDQNVKMKKSGITVGSNHANSNYWGNNYWDSWIYGNSTDLWGTTWTPSDINESGFGAGVSCTVLYGTVIAYVDWIAIKVYYSPYDVYKVNGIERAQLSKINNINFTSVKKLLGLIAN